MGGDIRRKQEWLDAQVKMHLGLLEQALFVEGIEENERRCYYLHQRVKLTLKTWN